MSRQTKSGIVQSGFVRKTYDEIREEIENTLNAHLGKINFADTTAIGQVVAIFTEREALLWEKLAVVYHSQYPDTAEGYSLDGVCALTGVKRLAATYSTVLCQLKAVNYTTIPKGSEVLVENSGSPFILVDTIVITNEKCQSVKLRLKPSRQQVFKININNYTIEHESLDDETNHEISEQLINQINEANINVNAELADDNIVITSNEVIKTFSCYVSENITVINCTNNALLRAKNKGAVIAPSHSLNIIQTPTYGWIGVSNVGAAIKGRNLESDIELKTRRNASLKLPGSGTVESIRARLMAIKGVTTVALTENNTSTEDSDGRPAQSFEALVAGGEDSNIAKVIWLAKPAGIQAWGNRVEIIKDSNGKKQAVKFSRPVKKYAYVRVKLKVAANFVDSSQDKIRQALVDQINSKGINESLIYQSLFASVYSTAGIMNADIKVGAATDEEHTPELGTANIEAKVAEIITTDLSKIVVEVV